jgi:hypothetical protein
MLIFLIIIHALQIISPINQIAIFVPVIIPSNNMHHLLLSISHSLLIASITCMILVDLMHYVFNILQELLDSTYLDRSQMTENIDLTDRKSLDLSLKVFGCFL